MTSEELLIRSLGGNRLFSGYEPLILCICLAVEDENRLLSLEQRLYPIAADRLQIKISAMKRNMSTLVQYCYNHADPALWKTIAGCPLKRQPTLREFIDFSACYIKQTKGRLPFTAHGPFRQPPHHNPSGSPAAAPAYSAHMDIFSCRHYSEDSGQSDAFSPATPAQDIWMRGRGEAKGTCGHRC